MTGAPIDISVVIPVYNSGQSLTELYQQLTKVLSEEGKNYELIFVDDASEDDSFVKLRELRAGDLRVKIIRLVKNYGQQHALFCGFHYLSGNLAITIDDDLQHPPEEIPALLRKIETGYDVVFGVSRAKKHSPYRNYGSMVINRILNLISRKPKEIKVGSFRVLRRWVVREILKTEKSFIYLAPLIFSVTTRAANVFVKHEPRRYGSSGYNPLKLIALSLRLIFHYSFLGKLAPGKKHSRFKIAEIYL